MNGQVSAGSISAGSISAGSIVLVHLINPTEKFFGVLEQISVAGVTFKGINLGSFDDWMFQAARGKPPSLGLTTMFVPLFRIERIFLDESVGEVDSYQLRFQRQVGTSVARYAGLEGDGMEELGDEEPS